MFDSDTSKRLRFASSRSQYPVLSVRLHRLAGDDLGCRHPAFFAMEMELDAGVKFRARSDCTTMRIYNESFTDLRKVCSVQAGYQYWHRGRNSGTASH